MTCTLLQLKLPYDPGSACLTQHKMNTKSEIEGRSLDEVERWRGGKPQDLMLYRKFHSKFVRVAGSHPDPHLHLFHMFPHVI